jgi:hypothetical protein
MLILNSTECEKGMLSRLSTGDGSMLIWNVEHTPMRIKTLMICGVCKSSIPSYKRREHLIEFHKIDNRLVDWIIMTDDELISLKPKLS